MKLGLGTMNISPRDFWGMTFKEFFCIWEARFGHLPKKITKSDLDEMIRRDAERGNNR